jgi:PAS domain S-box-containing protein
MPTVENAEDRSRGLAEAIPVGIFRMDGAGQCTYVNPALTALTGQTVAEAAGDGFKESIHPDDRFQAEDVWRSAAMQGKAFEAEVRISDGRGEYRWASVRTAAEYDDDGAVIGHVGTLSDVHDRVLAERAVRGNAAFHRHVLANLPGSTVAIFDRDLRCELFEGPYVQHTGRGPDWFVGRPLYDLLPGESVEELEPSLRAALEGEETSVGYSSPLSSRSLTMRIAPYRDSDGAIVGAIIVGHDVTAQREAEDARLEAEHRFEIAFDRAPIGMCLLSFEGNLLRVNQAMAEITGYSTDELELMSVLQLTVEDDQPSTVAHFGKVIAGADTHASEKRYRHAGGHVVWVEVKSNVIRDGDDRPLYLLAQIRDITERRENEARREELLAQQAEQVARLRELDSAKDEFVSFVSHELRTPLTSVQGYLDILREDADELSPSHQRFLETIHRNTVRLGRLVTDLLDLARVDAGKLELEVGETDLSELVCHAVQAAEPAAASGDLEVRADIAGDVILEGDAVRLAQVIDNLISNAVKYTGKGGEIDVRLERSGPSAVLSVADTGIGIPEAERDLLFERFYRASTATGRQIAGTGLGLSITKTIVEAHGGEVAVAGRDPQGTLFTVTLPLAPAR